MSILHSLTSIKKNSKKRVGRGYGSGVGGHTSGKGMKGQRSRGAHKIALWFEGGQLPLVKRLPMIRGKSRLVSLTGVQTVQLAQIAGLSLETISLSSLKEAGVIRRQTSAVKIVGTADLSRKLILEGVRVSQTARTAIEKAGGKISS